MRAVRTRLTQNAQPLRSDIFFSGVEIGFRVTPRVTYSEASGGLGRANQDRRLPGGFGVALKPRHRGTAEAGRFQPSQLCAGGLLSPNFV